VFLLCINYLINLVHICIAASELKSLSMGIKENIHMSIRSSPVFHCIDRSIDHQFCSQRNTAHGNRSSCCSLNSAGGDSVRRTTALSAETMPCKPESSQICTAAARIRGLTFLAS